MADCENAADQPGLEFTSEASAQRIGASLASSPFIEIFATTVPIATMAWFIGYYSGQSRSQPWLLIAAGTAAVLSIFWGAYIRRWFWCEPVRNLLATVDGAREGNIPLEEVSRSAGNMQPLASLFHDVLHSQKLQKTEIAELQNEMQDRIANRTNALERKIGSLKLQASRDVLTGLLNRRSLDPELLRLVALHQSEQRNACLLMIDVDHFKSLNDTLGHVAGDHLLKEIGQIIRSTIRDHDMAFRCGGDEFVVLLPDASSDAGEEISKRLQSLVEKLTQPLRLATPPRLSIGLCALSELESPTPQAWLEIADKRLYAIKSKRHTSSRADRMAPLRKSA